MERRIKVMIVDDHTIFRQGLVKLLESYLQIQVVGQFSNGTQAIEEVGRLSPDIILMDIKVPRMDGLERIRLIKEKHPDINVIILSMYEDADYVLRAIKAGASGYVQKSASVDRLIETITNVGRGRKSYFTLAIDSNILLKVADLSAGFERRGLSEQERQILTLIVDGHSNKQISQKIFLSEQTVKGYVHNILQKLDVSGRTQAAVVALRQGLVD